MQTARYIYIYIYIRKMLKYRFLLNITNYIPINLIAN